MDEPIAIIGMSGQFPMAEDIDALWRVLAEGKKLCAEEQAKRKLNGLDTWDLVVEHARDGPVRRPD